MVAGSFLVKDLLLSWIEGARWFWDTLVDADLANNTLGWQWVAGCGADAAPYFRIINPALYLMMAISAWLVWRERGFNRGAGALGLFALQLALNALWSPLFFGLRSPLAGLVDIVPLWAAILGALVSFWTISPLAGALLVPYWLWVSFATVLNLEIWRLNR